MPKTKISEFSATPANNTDIDSINIAEGCAPSGINDAIRELMAQLKDFQTGAQGDSFNGPIGSTTPAAGAFTTLSASSTTTLSGLTASTALALDASKNIVSVTNTGTGNNVLATSPTLVTPNLGVPSFATLTSATGLPISTGVSGLGTGVATFLATPSSANLAAALTDETGTGSAVFATSPTLVTPVLGVATGTSFQGIIGNVTPAAGSFTTLGASSTATLNTLSSSGATLTGGTINGMTVGATTASSGAFTTVTASTPIGTASGGTGLGGATPFTSGGVVYASSASALATGSALQFDGTNLSVGTTALSGGKFSTLANLTAVNGLVIRDSATTYANNDNYVLLQNSTGATAGGLTHPASESLGVWGKDDIRFLQGYGATEQMRLTSTGLGLGVTPSAWSIGKAIEVGSLGNGILGWGANDISVSSGCYYNAGWKWSATNSLGASHYEQYSGTSYWFVAAPVSHTAGDPITFTQAMSLTADGNLLLGTTSYGSYSTVKLTLCGDSAGAKWAVGPTTGSYNSFYISTSGSTGVYLANTAATSWSSVSDERFKTDFQPIENAVEKVCSLRALTGRYKEDTTNTRKSFLIAQDVLAVLPEAVDTANPEKYGLSYTDTIPLLVAAIKELKSEFDAYKATHP